jgi:hypothetical protein
MVDSVKRLIVGSVDVGGAEYFVAGPGIEQVAASDAVKAGKESRWTICSGARALAMKHNVVQELFR